jgi:hypothetical protein
VDNQSEGRSARTQSHLGSDERARGQIGIFSIKGSRMRTISQKVGQRGRNHILGQMTSRHFIHSIHVQCLTIDEMYSCIGFYEHICRSR